MLQAWLVFNEGTLLLFWEAEALHYENPPDLHLNLFYEPDTRCL